MRVLFISYHYSPFQGVGAKRMTYWAENCHKFGIEPTVITATKQEEINASIIHLSPLNEAGFLGKFIKDEGLKWLPVVTGYFKSIKTFNYDVVLISGGPFMHFSLAKFFKQRFNTKVVLDFRDPFSTNPGFEDNWVKKSIKRYFEKRFIKHADGLIAVNKYCEKLIVPHDDKPTYIIDNGYDDTQLEVQPLKKTTAKTTIVHAGTFLKGQRNPTAFLHTIRDHFAAEVLFYQYGKNSDYLTPFEKQPFYAYKGMVPYKQLMEELNRADICLLVTAGKAFESTTKVFDYIGLNKKILVVTNGIPKTGNLHAITKGYPNIVWTKNEPKAIAEGVLRLIKKPLVQVDTYPYSRANSLKKLVDALKELTAN